MLKEPSLVVPLKLQQVKPETGDTKSFIFAKPPDFNYLAGQFGRWRLEHPESDERGITRPFTLSSSPTEPHLSLTTRFTPDLSSSFKKALAELNPGDEILFEGPKGDFTLPEDSSQPVVLLAGGVGITPFRSMIKFAQDTNPTRPITLFYTNRTKADIIFQNELGMWSQADPNFKLIFILSRAEEDWAGEKGHLNEEVVKRHLPDLSGPLFYVCGPEGMIKSYREILLALGVADERIKVESFSGY